jgi:soluble lytic murein transglycosylase-like protein
VTARSAPKETLLAFRPRPARPTILVLTTTVAAFFAASLPARAGSPTEQYLQARQNYPPKTNLTLAGAARDPDACRGATLEVTGRLLGMARAETGASLMIDTGASGVLNLQMSRVPDWVQNGGRLRALCVIGGAKQNNISIGMPELLVVAVVSESDIAVAEVRWQKQRLARAADSKRYRSDLNRLAALYASGKIRLPGRSSGGGSSSALRTSAFRGTLLASRGASASRGNGSTAADVFGQYRAFIRASNTRLTEAQVDDITTAILRSSEQMDVDPRLIVALIIAESSFDPSATSRAGAMGLGQIMPGTAAEIGLSNPYDPVQNIQGAVYLLKTRLDKYSGGATQNDLQMRHIHLALAAYNAGMGAVKRYKGIPPYRETRNYIKKIERLYRQLCGEDNAPLNDAAAPSDGRGGGAS